MQRSDGLAILLAGLADRDYCYLTTTGRVSGRPHEIEIWFGLRASTLYLLSGSDRSDWVKNLRRNPSVTVRIAQHTFTGRERPVEAQAEDQTARYLIARKYQEWEAGQTLSKWARTALPVAIDLSPSAAPEQKP